MHRVATSVIIAICISFTCRPAYSAQAESGQPPDDPESTGLYIDAE